MNFLRKGTEGLIVFAQKCRVKEDIISLTQGKDKNNFEVFAFPSSNNDLGELCKKPFAVSVLFIKKWDRCP